LIRQRQVPANPIQIMFRSSWSESTSGAVSNSGSELQVAWMALGIPPSSKYPNSSREEAENEARAFESLLVFTPPEVERSRRFVYLLLLFIPINIILLTVALKNIVSSLL